MGARREEKIGGDSLGAIVEWSRFDVIDCRWSKSTQIFLGMKKRLYFR